MPPPVAMRMERSSLERHAPSSAVSVETLSTTYQIAGIADRERLLLDELRLLQEKKKWLAQVLTQVGSRERENKDSDMDDSRAGRRHSRPRLDGPEAARKTERIFSSASQPNDMQKRTEDSKERLRVLGESSQRLNAQLQVKISELTADQRSSEFSKSDPYNFLNTYTRKLGYLKARASVSEQVNTTESRAKKSVLPTRIYTDLNSENVAPQASEDRQRPDGPLRRAEILPVPLDIDKRTDEEAQFTGGNIPEKTVPRNVSREEPFMKPTLPIENQLSIEVTNSKSFAEEFISTPIAAEKFPLSDERKNINGSENTSFVAERPSLARRVGSNEILNSGRILSPKLISLASVQQRNSPKTNDERSGFRPVEMVPLVPPQDAVPFIDVETNSYRSPPYQIPPPVIPAVNFNETPDRNEGGPIENGRVHEKPTDFSDAQLTRNFQFTDSSNRVDSSFGQSQQVYNYDDDFLPESPANFRPKSPVISPASDTSSGINFVARQPDNIGEEEGRDVGKEEADVVSVIMELSDGEVTPRVDAGQTSPHRWQSPGRYQGANKEDRLRVPSPLSSVRSLTDSPASVAEIFASDNEFNAGSEQSAPDEERQPGQLDSESEISSVKSDFLSGSSTSSNRTLQEQEPPSSVAEDFPDSLKEQEAFSEVAGDFQDESFPVSPHGDISPQANKRENGRTAEGDFRNNKVADQTTENEKLDRGDENLSPKGLDGPEVLDGTDDDDLSTLETVSSLSPLSSIGNGERDTERQFEEGEVGIGDSSQPVGTSLTFDQDSLNGHDWNNERGDSDAEARRKENEKNEVDDEVGDDRMAGEFDIEERTEDDVESVDSASLLVSFANNEAKGHLVQADKGGNEAVAEEPQAEDRAGSSTFEQKLLPVAIETHAEEQKNEMNERSPTSFQSKSPLTSVSENLKSLSGDERAESVSSPRTEEPLDKSSSSPGRPSPRKEEQTLAVDLLVSPRGMDATMPVQDWIEDDFFSGILPPGTPDIFKEVVSPRKSVRAKSPPVGDFVRQARLKKSVSHVQSAARYVHSVMRENRLQSFFDVHFPSSEFSSGFTQETQMAFDFVIDFCDQMYVLPGIPPVTPKQRFPENVEQFLRVMESQYERQAARLILPEPGVKLDRNERDELDQQAVYNLSFKDLERHENEWCNFTVAEASLKAETANEIWDDLVDEMVVEFQENKHFDEWLRRS